MLKTKCHLAFTRSFVQSLFNSSKTVRYDRSVYTRGRSLLNLNHRRKLEQPCCYLVHYCKNADISSDALTKHSPGLDIALDVGVKQPKDVPDNTDVSSCLSWKQKFRYYLKLSKIRLTGLVVLTTMAGYSLAPGEFSAASFALASLGTLLCSCSANTFNQWLEVPFDSQMSRTKNRVLVRGVMSPSHALLFGLTAGASGLSILFTQVNGLTAILGASTLILYTAVYTPLKRLSIVNTWIGSVVGALPPLMGWTACTGTLEPGALILGGILYSWQFPHFNALSWNLRADYSRAGYRMMSVLNPELCRKVTLRHCASLVTLSTLLPVCDVTTWWLALDSLPVNLWFTWLAWKFNKQSDNKSARELFHFSLLHLPILMFLVLFHKKSRKDEVTDALQV